MSQEPGKIVGSRGLRLVLIAAGLCCTILAVIGIFVPLLPTVPFLLLAAACFARSSKRFYRWLLDHRQLGPMVRDYLGGKGIPLRAKITAITLIWVSISVSTLFLLTVVWVKILMLAIGICVTAYLWRLPLCESEDG
jgi:uncharacterized membrane protein YbaN (DUF454 family)